MDWTAERRLSELIEASGMKQVAIATRMGKSESWVSNRAVGITPLKANEIPKFADVLGVPCSDFFEGSDCPEAADSPEVLLIPQLYRGYLNPEKRLTPAELQQVVRGMARLAAILERQLDSAPPDEHDAA